MKLIINGQAEEIQPDGLTVTELLAVKSVDRPDMVSVELNGEFVKRPEFSTTKLKSGDQVEFLYFMGGGGRSEAKTPRTAVFLLPALAGDKGGA